MIDKRNIECQSPRMFPFTNKMYVPGNILVRGLVFFAICSLFVSRQGEEEHSHR